MNTENFKEKINYILNNQNREEIDKIRYNGYILANQYHTSEHRAKQLIEIINNTSNVVYESSSKSSQNVRRYLQCQLLHTVGGDVGDGFR